MDLTYPSKVSVLEKVRDEPLSFKWVTISANADFFNFSRFSGLTSWAAKKSSAPVVEIFFQSPENATKNRKLIVSKKNGYPNRTYFFILVRFLKI